MLDVIDDESSYRKIRAIGVGVDRRLVDRELETTCVRNVTVLYIFLMNMTLNCVYFSDKVYNPGYRS